jgi:cytochrome c oxidase subunit 2
MALMAKAVDSERKLGDLVAYLASLPVPDRSTQSIGGDVDRGQDAYTLCAACHGSNGESNEALGAPGLVQLDDWYVVEQLRVYAEGLRGVHRDDSYGQQMRALGPGFSEPELQRSLAAYINTLSN